MNTESVQSSDILHLIKNQNSSTGEKGWPTAVRDRIAFPSAKEFSVTKANVAVTFLWTMRDSVLPFLETENLALATNFYTPAGLVGMVRNILSNPFIRYIILLGEEYSSRSKDDKISEITSGNALRIFFEKGITSDRKLPGFENAVIFDKTIPVELINKIKNDVKLIDLNKQMPNATIQQKIAEANRLMKILDKKSPFIEKPMTFEYEKSTAAFPFEGGPLIVHGSTIPKTWVEIVHNIYRYGKDNLMNANTDRWIKEINNVVAVVHDPQNMDLSFNPFLIPLTKEKIEAYKKEILSPILPEGKAYTYGNKLRAYLFNSPEYIKNLANTKDFKDFEFGKGSHVEKNVKHFGTYSEIDQLDDMIDVLKRDPYSKAALALTWHPADELMRKHKSSPCLVMIQPMVHDEKLNMTVYFRSHDMTQGWPENAYGCAAIQQKVALDLGIEPGILTIISSSAQIYNHYYAQVEDMLSKNRKQEESFKDPRGNYVIEVKNNKIIVMHNDPVSGKQLEQFEGGTAKEVYNKISHANNVSTNHAMYLGAELMAAQLSIENSKTYQQDLFTK